ncbi:ACT domain-containing protein [Pyrofollis japonicus]|uniref:ACT domain-containing protein n=1 Tax=Pyrofollis japonicus TaxID=3060460 RepID=UPI00295B44C6|nr:ACT domain-containing protein [Pyrofollis japonicus]
MLKRATRLGLKTLKSETYPVPPDPDRTEKKGQEGIGAMSAQNLSTIVRRIVDTDPVLQECLARGIANYSETARRIKPLVEKEAGMSASVDAIKTALIRYAQRLRGQAGLGAAIPQQILARSSIELRMGVTVVVASHAALSRLINILGELLGKARLLFIMQSVAGIVIIVSKEYADKVLSGLGDTVIEVSRDRAVIVIASPRDVITTPGFLAYITGLFARNKINIEQIESVYTDTIIVVSPDDALKAFQLLNTAIEEAKIIQGSGGA